MKNYHYRDEKSAARKARSVGCSHVVVVDESTFTCHRSKEAAWDRAKSLKKVTGVVRRVEGDELKGEGRIGPRRLRERF